jgi:hypothetical protein
LACGPGMHQIRHGVRVSVPDAIMACKCVISHTSITCTYSQVSPDSIIGSGPAQRRRTRASPSHQEQAPAAATGVSGVPAAALPW